MKNTFGFSILELLVIVVILGLLALAAVRTFTGSDEEKSIPDTIDESKEAIYRLSVDGYAKAIETTVSTYLIMHSDVSTVKIAVDGNEGTFNNKTVCHVDATTLKSNVCKAKDAEKVVYSGATVSCQTANYNMSTGHIELSGCKVDNSANTYKYSISTGVIKE